jgi:outer membrane protein TolC
MRSLLVPLLAIPLLMGCQSYKPAPLEEQALLAAWRERSPSLPLVRDFAAQQASLSGIPSAFDVSDGLNLAEAETLALLFNPSLRTSRLLAGVARAGSAEAGRWEDPRLGVDAQRIISSTDDPWVVGGLINLTIPLSGRLTFEKQLALAEADTELLKVLDHERLLIADLRKLWADWSAATMRASVIEQAISDLTLISTSAARLRDAGEIDPTDSRLFDIDLVRRQAQLLSARRDAARLQADLRQLIGLSPTTPLTLLPSLDTQPTEPTLPATQHVKVQIARSEYAIAERALELEIRKQYPDLDLGGGFGTDQGDSRILGGFSLPLPLLNANRRAIAEAAARRDAVRASFEQQLIATDSAIAQNTADLSAASQQLNQIETALIPLVDRQLIDARKLLEVGEFNPLLLREAIASSADAKLDLLAARTSLAHSAATQAYWTEFALAAPTTKENP